MEDEREFFIEIRIYRDTNKSTWDKTERFESFEDAIEFLEEYNEEE